jgi:hypothetical protein
VAAGGSECGRPADDTLASELPAALSLGMAGRLIQDTYGWQTLDSAPVEEDVSLLVTDGPSEPYPLRLPSRLTAAGWVSSARNAVGGDANEVEAVHRFASCPTSRKRKMTPLRFPGGRLVPLRPRPG